MATVYIHQHVINGFTIKLFIGVISVYSCKFLVVIDNHVFEDPICTYFFKLCPPPFQVTRRDLSSRDRRVGCSVLAAFSMFRNFLKILQWAILKMFRFSYISAVFTKFINMHNAYHRWLTIFMIRTCYEKIIKGWFIRFRLEMNATVSQMHPP